MVYRSLVPSGVELTSLEVACLAQVLIAAIPKERAFIHSSTYKWRNQNNKEGEDMIHVVVTYTVSWP